MKWSISKAAVEFGSSRETISRGLRGNGVTVSTGKEFTTKQIFAALSGDLKYERTRRERAQATKLEMQNKIRDGQLIELATAERVLWAELLMPLKQEMDAMPDKLAPLVNPENPADAKKHLFAWVEETKKKLLMRNSQPKE